MNKIVYRLIEAPRYLREHEAVRIADTLLWQSAFWNTMRTLIEGATDSPGSVEVRIAADGSEVLQLWVIATLPENDTIAPETLAKLLPRDYRWRQEPYGAFRDRFEAGFRSPTGWHVARLWRRVELVTLPNVQPWMQPAGILDKVEDTASLIAPMDAKRRLPLPHIPLHDQMLATDLCVPIVGEVRADTADRWRFLQDMLDFGRTVVSIALHPISAEAVEDDRRASAYLQRALESIDHPAAREGMIAREDVLRTYQRYWGACSNLCYTTIRIASESVATSVALAHNLAVRLGDMRAFEVRPPSKTIPSIIDLGDIGWEVPTAQALRNEPQAWANLLKHGLSAMGVDDADVGKGVTGFPEHFLLRLPHLYTMKEAENIIKLPFAFDEGLPGIEVRPLPPFYPPVTRLPDDQAAPVDDAQRIRLGLHRQGSTERWHTINQDDMTRHLFLTGTTGSGKSVLCQSLLCELDRLGVPFLIIEPVKTEYYDSLRARGLKLQRWRFEGEGGVPAPDFVPIDPMRLLPQITVSRHISNLMACFRGAFPMDNVMALLLEGGLRAYYCSSTDDGGCGLRLMSTGGRDVHRFDRTKDLVYPSFAHFQAFFLGVYLKREFTPNENVSSRSFSNASLERLWTYQQVFLRRFRALSEGPLGIGFQRANKLWLENKNAYSLVSYWLSRPTIIELDALTDPEHKSFFMSLLLISIFELRQAQDALRRRKGQQEPIALQHVMVLEEAHRILERKSSLHGYQGDEMGIRTDIAASLFIDMLAEIRAYGQGVMLVEQIPTKIVSEAIKNTSTKMMMCLPAEDDRRYMGTAMNCNAMQQDYVAMLETGQVAVYERNVDRPVLLRVPDPRQRLNR